MERRELMRRRDSYYAFVCPCPVFVLPAMEKQNKNAML